MLEFPFPIYHNADQEHLLPGGDFFLNKIHIILNINTNKIEPYSNQEAITIVRVHKTVTGS